jgi:hypothetical protein
MSEDSTTKMQKLPHKSVPVVCAWCGRLYRISRSRMDEKRTIRSHGICNECLRKIQRNKQPEQDFCLIGDEFRH